jgi:hypothetical protein
LNGFYSDFNILNLNTELKYEPSFFI